MAFTVSGKIEGLNEITATLKGLPGKLERKIIRGALAKATKPLVSAARRRARRVSGLLRRSIYRKTVTYGSGTIVAVIGPRTDTVGLVARGYGKGLRKSVPAWYAHLVELGTRPHRLAGGSRLKESEEQAGKRVKGQQALILAIAAAPEGKRGKLYERLARRKRAALPRMRGKQAGAQHPGAKAYPFLRPAFEESRAEVVRRFALEVARGIEAEAARELGRGRHRGGWG